MVKKKAAVIGYPVKHSLSPLLHQYWLKVYGLEEQYEYGLLEITPESLETRLDVLADQGYVGINVTIPHKETVFAYIEKHGELDDVAKKIGAVNTVLIKSDGSLFGTNTDAYGFIHNLIHQQPQIKFKNKTILVLGAGGAARAVIYGLIEQQVKKIIVVNRTKEHALALQTFFSNLRSRIEVVDWEDRNTSHVLENVDIYVNSTSLGMQGKPALDVAINVLPKESFVTDIIYRPLQTELLQQAESLGLRTIDGMGMLIYQAVRGFELFFGKKPEVTPALRALMKKHIAG